MPGRTHQAAGSPNPAEDREFRRALQRHVEHLAATVRYADPAAHRPSGHAEAQRREQIAAAWVYLSSIAVWAEDHGLVMPLLRDHPRGVIRNRASSLLWLGRAFGQLTTGGVHLFELCGIPRPETAPCWPDRYRSGPQR